MTTKHTTVRTLSALIACGALVVGCAPPSDLDPVEYARAVNQNRSVNSTFPEHPLVVEDPFGLETSRLFFEKSETVIVVDETVTAGLRGASVAMVAHAPMLVYKPAHHHEVVEEIQRLGAHMILTVGVVSLAPAHGTVRVIRDSGGMDALGEMTALAFDVVEVHHPDNAIAAIVGADEDDPVWLKALWADPVVGPRAKASPFPAQAPRDADMAPKVVATDQSDLAAVTNARSFGAEVSLVVDPNPVRNRETLREMIGLSDRPLVALGQEFGSDAQLAARIRAGEVRIKAELSPAGTGQR